MKYLPLYIVEIRLKKYKMIFLRTHYEGYNNYNLKKLLGSNDEV